MSSVILLGAPLSAGQHLDDVLTVKRKELELLTYRLTLMPAHDSLYLPGLILSVESNQNVESKMKNVESKPRNCGVQNWFALQELVPSYTEQPVFCTFA